MTHPYPVVIPGSGVPEVEQDFADEVARHGARLDAERAANQPVTPAEERTGISDVQHAVLGEVAKLRRLVESNPGVAITYAAPEVILASLDRIEQWTRGAK